MDKTQKGPILILVGIILVVIDLTILVWFPSLILTYIGICLCCSGILQTSKSARSPQSGYQPSYQPQYQPQPGPQPIQPLPPQERRPEDSRFWPYCGTPTKERFCPGCGKEID
ncbi:MAG: hypothetical protein ACTSR8_08910 [Promethearchaeota archaeon]